MSIQSIALLFTAGLLTFASPCVLPMLPVYVSVLGGADSDESARRRRVRLAGIGFALGVSVVFVALGMGASALATTLAAHRRALMIGAGALMIFFGAKLAGVIRSAWLEREARPLLDRVPGGGGLASGFVFGAAFSIGWTPCVGPVLGGALTYAASTSASPWTAGAQLGVYALGLSTPLVAAAFAAERVLGWARRFRAHTPKIQRATGALLVLAGVMLATDSLALLVPTATPTDVAGGSACEAPGATACEAPKVALGAAGTTPAEPPTGMPRLLEFTSTHCVVCAKMAPLLAELERSCAPAGGAVMRIDVDDPSARPLLAHYNVRLLPTFISVDAEGREVERIVGEQTRARLAIALADVHGTACTPM